MIRGTIAGLAVVIAATVSVMPTPGFADRPLWETLETDGRPVLVAFAAGGAAPGSLSLVKSYGPSGAPSSGGNGSGGLEFGEAEINSFGCFVGGSVGMGAALAIGGINISNLIAGGLVPAANPAALYASLFGVVFATFCAVGQAITPLAVYAYRRYLEEAEAPPMVLLAPERAVTPGVRKSSFELR